jgi:membrane protein DedA with SNARE-associated domain
MMAAEEMIIQLLYWLKDLSYLGIALALTVEAVPAEIVLPLAGYWVSQGDYRYFFTVLAGIIGGVLGPLTLYALGRFGGRPMVVKYGRYFLIKERHVASSDRFFEKYGAGVAFFGRFIPLVRTAISVPCGMAKMNVWLFMTYTALGVTPITLLYVYVGMKLGEHWERAGEIVSPYARGVGLSILLVLLFIAWVKWSKKRAKRIGNGDSSYS